MQTEIVNVERAFVNCVFNDQKLLNRAVGVHGGWFQDEYCRKAFDVIFDHYNNNRSIDSAALSYAVNDDFMVREILDSNYSINAFETYLDILKDNYIKISLQRRASQVLEELKQGDVSGRDELDKLLSELNQLSMKTISDLRTSKMSDVGVEVMKKIKKTKEEGITPYRATTDLKSLCKIIPGLEAGDYTILAARPSMGKTAYAVQLALHNAIKNDVPVGIISLEMTSEQLYMRHLVHETGINSQRIKEGQITDAEYEQLTDVWKKTKAVNAFFDDTSNATDLDVKAISRRMKQEHNIQMLVIDYIQLLESGKRSESRQHEIGKISRSIKSLAKELDIPILALSQLSRAVEERQGGRPKLSDLRDSGSLEMDADQVIFLYRPSKYGVDKFDDGISTDGITELIVAKYRNGATGSARVAFIEDRMLFADLDISSSPTPEQSEDEPPEF